MSRCSFIPCSYRQGLNPALTWQDRRRSVGRPGRAASCRRGQHLGRCSEPLLSFDWQRLTDKIGALSGEQLAEIVQAIR